MHCYSVLYVHNQNLLVVSMIVTVATPGVPTVWPVTIASIETLKLSSPSSTLSSFIIISNEALVDPTWKVTVYGPEL